MIKDPFDPEVIAAAKASGIPDSKIDAAQKSPVYQFVNKWKLALPLHPEFRTLPMLFYVPPLGPVARQNRQRRVRQRGLGGEVGAVDELAGKIARVAALYGEPVVGRQ